MKKMRTLILWVKRKFHLIIAVMALIGLISCVANLLTGGWKEDGLSITVNAAVILLFSYFFIINSLNHYRQIKNGGY